MSQEWKNQIVEALGEMGTPEARSQFAEEVVVRLASTTPWASRQQQKPEAVKSLKEHIKVTNKAISNLNKSFNKAWPLAKAAEAKTKAIIGRESSGQVELDLEFITRYLAELERQIKQIQVNPKKSGPQTVAQTEVAKMIAGYYLNFIQIPPTTDGEDRSFDRVCDVINSLLNKHAPYMEPIGLKAREAAIVSLEPLLEEGPPYKYVHSYSWGV